MDEPRFIGTADEALEIARGFAKSLRRSLAYPASDFPFETCFIDDGEPPHIVAGGGPIGRRYWQYHFKYQYPDHILISSNFVRIFVDSRTGLAAQFSLR